MVLDYFPPICWSLDRFEPAVLAGVMGPTKKENLICILRHKISEVIFTPTGDWLHLARRKHLRGKQYVRHVHTCSGTL